MKMFLLHLFLHCLCLFSLLPASLATCGGLQGDVVFILDASGSVGYSNFQLVLQFVNDLVQDFDIGSDLVRVGVVRYESSVSTILYLDDDFDKTSLQTAIANITYTGGLTETAQALQHTHTTMFTAAHGDRSNIPNIAIIITDGVSSSDPTTQAALARSAGITIFSIGVGTGVSELNAMATDPDSDHVFTVSSFSGLVSIEGAFQTKACTSNTFIANPNTANSTESGSSDDTAAIVGGVVAGVAALGAAGVAGGILYSKMSAAKTAVKTVNPAIVEQGTQQPKSQPSEPTEPEMSIPGMIDAPAQIQPMDTRWPARLPPLRI